MQICSILDQIDLGNYALPVFQRGFVWNRDQVRQLMSSLYKKYPIGSLLIWDTKTYDNSIIRSGSEHQSGNIKLILDGQQRITSLYGIIRGEEPPFFEGNARAFTNLYFNVLTEIFEFYGPMKMDDNKDWISVTELMQKGAGTFVEERQYLIGYLNRLNSLDNIKMQNLPIQEVTGVDKTVDIVVDIFNRVNSGGTKLSKGDLALAKLCASWPEARNELNDILDYFEDRGFFFTMDWLLRCITVYLTSQPYFAALSDIDISDFQKSLPAVKKMIATILNHLGSRLGLDHDRVLKSKFSFAVIIQIIKNEGGSIEDDRLWNKIMYWFVHTFLWGRYSGSTESVLAQDLNILRDGEGVDGLIAVLKKNRGNLEIQAEDFISWSTGSRLYPLLYLMTRVYGSRDWISGLELKDSLLGKNSSLEIHHVFPKSILYDDGFDKTEVNTLANYTFLTKESNIKISNQEPKKYLSAIYSKNASYLESHWIPMKPSLWDVEQYLNFVKARQRLLADAANEFLNSLYSSEESGSIAIAETADASISRTAEEEMILDLGIWMESKGFAPGEMYHEINDADGENLAVFDLAWPEGIQEGLSQPIAVLIDEPDCVLEVANCEGYKFFTEIDEFISFVEREYLED